MTIPDFIGKKVIYDNSGQYLWGVNEKDELQMLADVRGWGAIQNKFKKADGSIDFEKAKVFQDEFGEWIADALNIKLTK